MNIVFNYKCFSMSIYTVLYEDIQHRNTHCSIKEKDREKRLKYIVST